LPRPLDDEATNSTTNDDCEGDDAPTRRTSVAVGMTTPPHPFLVIRYNAFCEEEQFELLQWLK
jgi:hypothetical protein